jgi:hypothetical protein
MLSSGLSFYVCERSSKSLSSYVCKRPTKVDVILRPPKDLAVLPLRRWDVKKIYRKDAKKRGITMNPYHDDTQPFVA